MLGRRLLLIVAILMGITALTAGLAAPPSGRDALPAPTSRAAGAAVDAALVERELDASARRATTVVVNEGETLQLTVSAATLDSVEIVGLDQLEAVAPAAPAIFDVLADRPGTYPIVLLAADRRLGALRVTPARE